MLCPWIFSLLQSCIVNYGIQLPELFVSHSWSATNVTGSSLRPMIPCLPNQNMAKTVNSTVKTTTLSALSLPTGKFSWRLVAGEKTYHPLFWRTWILANRLIFESSNVLIARTCASYFSNSNFPPRFDQSLALLNQIPNVRDRITAPSKARSGRVHWSCTFLASTEFLHHSIQVSNSVGWILNHGNQI